MRDCIQQMGTATIQHGPDSDRVYLMKLGREAVTELAPRLEQLAAERGYTKIFTKVPPRAASLLAERGYVEEARIPGYFRREEDAVFMSRFLDPRRAVDPDADRIKAILDSCSGAPCARQLPEDCEMRAATRDDLSDMAELYREVFPTYPFPIHDPAYLLETMNSHIRYFIVREAGRLVAASSGELDAQAEASEMTDFATRPSHRGKGLASCLLGLMEHRLSAEGVRTAFTIARAVSPGMNKAFARSGYVFAGTLTRNTQISGRIESMNVWHKPVTAASKVEVT